MDNDRAVLRRTLHKQFDNGNPPLSASRAEHEGGREADAQNEEATVSFFPSVRLDLVEHECA